MNGQTSIPDGPEPPKYTPVCGWCSEPATSQVEIEAPVKSNSGHGFQIVKKAAVLAPTCAYHQKLIQASVDRTTEEKRKAKEKKLEKRRAHS